nr:MAG TPA: hypothetical protein [Caudoviricetes sp.]
MPLPTVYNLATPTKSGHISVRFLLHNVKRCCKLLSRFVLIYPALSRLSCWVGWVFLKGFQQAVQ